jgi:cation:H+ antiporter
VRRDALPAARALHDTANATAPITMTADITQFLVAALVIVVAGAALTQFGDIIANRTKLGGLLVGTILIAGATSLPELGVNITSVRRGDADLAVGDLVGSSLINLLILAVLDLTRYSHGRMLSKGSARQALGASSSVALTAIAAIFIMLSPRIGEFEIWRAGPGMIVLLAAYLMCLRLIHHGRQGSDREAEEGHAIWPPVLRKLELKGAVVGYLIAGAVILMAAPFLSRAAGNLAEQTGLGGTFFGSTFVALSTSLPEIATTFTAVRMRALDMAMGNILGSNAFNMVLLIPLDLVYDGSLLAAAASSHAYTALCVILVTCVVLLSQLYPVERKKPFYEPDALLTITLIIASFTGLYFIK